MRVLGWIFSIFLHLTVVLASLVFINIEPVKFQLNAPVYEVDLVSLGAPGLPHLRDVEAVADLALSRGFLLPGLDCGACGESCCADMAARIVDGKATPADCQAVREAMRVTVGGVPLAMNPFVERILAAGIKAMLAQLKGFAPGRVEIGLDA